MWYAGVKFVDEFLERLPKADERGQRVVDVTEASRQVTLMAIAAAGFGVQVDWPEADPAASFDLVETLRRTIQLIILKSLGPGASRVPIRPAATVTEAS